MAKVKIYFLVLLMFTGLYVQAQTLTKEAMNSFAMYTKTQDVKQLEKARKQIDDAYKTSKDSASYKNNLIRSLVYSTLAFVDADRKYDYEKDPIEEAKFSFQLLQNPKLNDEYAPERAYIKKQLANSYLIKANTALYENNYSGALDAYLSVDSIALETLDVTHNLAVLSERLGYLDEAISYYEKLLAGKQMPENYYLALANLYQATGNVDKMLETLQAGRERFQKSKELIYKEINFYADNENYTAVLTLIDDALKLDEHNINLNYLAGFSYDITGDKAKAKHFYEKIIAIDPNNYDGNYALGLLYLNLYLHKTKDTELMLKARQYLSIANEIDPNKIKTLRSLAILYKNNGDMIELERVNNKLNQVILN